MVIALCWFAAAPACASGPTLVSFVSLLDEMADPESVARWPDPSFTLKQASSYDRLSKTPGNVDWFANSDWSNFVRTEQVKTSAAGERTEYVMMDEPGPGAIVRFWAGGFTNKGALRFYVDESSEPILIGTADEVIGGQKYFPQPFAAVRSRGLDLYAPIPYAKRIKITYDGPLPDKTDDYKNEVRFWYNINYRVYAPGTKVQSFSLAQLVGARQSLGRVAQALTNEELLAPSSPQSLEPKQTIRKTLQARSGGAAIKALQLKIRAKGMDAALRQTVLSITFDGHKTVSVPVGDFFGSGVGVNAFQDDWRHVSSDGTMSARWVMPYRQTCDIELTNHGEQAVEYELTTAQKLWKCDDRSLYFHASWHRQPINASKLIDFNYLTTSGARGVYVGDTLAVFNPIASWWGEGDEKIWVDSESFPSNFGTGTEDYYGYAWGNPEPFTAPFHAQPRGGARNEGHTTNSRVRALDRIPFRKALKLDMEVWHWCNVSPKCVANPVTMDYAVATFWYGDWPAGTAAHLDPKDLIVPGDRP